MAMKMISNVPAAELDGVDTMLRNLGATRITHTPEPDGEFTVIGFFPDTETHAAFKARMASD